MSCTGRNRLIFSNISKGKYKINGQEMQEDITFKFNNVNACLVKK